MVRDEIIDGDEIIEAVHSHGARDRTVIRQPHVSDENAALLKRRLRDALIDNVTFLEGPQPPTLVESDAQIFALTRQVNALIRLTLNMLADPAGA